MRVFLTIFKVISLALITLLLPVNCGDEALGQDIPACATINPESVKAFAEARKASSNCPVGCRGCGCKGGPGYRKSDQQCASYAGLVRDCGPPPHAGCSRECAPVVGGCRRPSAQEIEKAATVLVEAFKNRPSCPSGYRYANQNRCVGVRTAKSLCLNDSGVCVPDSVRALPTQ